jgi:MFS family permease
MLNEIFRSLKYKNYRLYFMGQSISNIGTWIQRIAMPWLVYHLTGSVVLLGVVTFCNQIPNFILSPVAGVISDRLNRYHIIIVTQILATMQALLLAILFFTGTIQVWHIIVLGLLLGCVNAFEMPARQSFVVDLVEIKADMSNAIALNSSIINSARLLGPSIAGVLIAATNEGVCFLINAISYLFVIASLLSMKLPHRKIKKKDTHPWQELKDGMSYAFGFAPIRSIILLLALVSLMGMPYTVLMPVFAKDILHGSASTFGFLMGATGVGALTASIYLASRKSVLGLLRIIPLSSAIFGAGLIAFSFSRSFLLSMVLMFATGIGLIMQMASSNTILQTIVDDDKRGRIMSLFAMAMMGTTPFGGLLAGGLADRLGAPNTLLIGGISCILGAWIFARKIPYIKKVLRPVYIKLGILPAISANIQAVEESIE